MEHDRSHYRPEESEGSGASPEQQRAPYSRAARYRRERATVRAYQQAQSLIYREDTDLSAFRFHVEEMWHVAVVGEEPPEEIQQQIERTLSSGEAIPLPQDVLALLRERRRQAQALGPWVEGHYRPGRAYRLPEENGGKQP